MTRRDRELTQFKILNAIASDVSGRRFKDIVKDSGLTEKTVFIVTKAMMKKYIVNEDGRYRITPEDGLSLYSRLKEKEHIRNLKSTYVENYENQTLFISTDTEIDKKKEKLIREKIDKVKSLIEEIKVIAVAKDVTLVSSAPTKNSEKGESIISYPSPSIKSEDKK